MSYTKPPRKAVSYKAGTLPPKAVLVNV